MKPYNNTSISLKTLIVCLLALTAATVTTRAQTVVNNPFTNPNLDLVTNGIIGSGFDGADLALGDIAGGNTAGLGNNAATLQANDGSIIGFPGAGAFYVQTLNDAWGQGGPGDTGFFAFNIVYGDFTASVELLGPYANTNYDFSGLMARAISDGTGGPYTPPGTNASASENWESITEFDEFGILTMSEDMVNGGSAQIANNGPGSLGPGGSLSNLDSSGDVWLQLSRSGNTFIMSDSPDGVTWHPEY